MKQSRGVSAFLSSVHGYLRAAVEEGRFNPGSRNAFVLIHMCSVQSAVRLTEVGLGEECASRNACSLLENETVIPEEIAQVVSNIRLPILYLPQIPFPFLTLP